MEDKVELCWRMYLENTTQGRHHETMRASLTTLISAIAAGSLGLIKTETPSCAQLPLALLVVALGVFGAIVSRKRYERFVMHMHRARAYRRRLDELVVGADLSILKREGDAAHNAKFPVLGKLSLAWLWSSMNLAVVLLGLAAAWSILSRNSCW